ncbi:MAG: hypothetical protein ACOZQL_28630 [Myxococcota bacterium]
MFAALALLVLSATPEVAVLSSLGSEAELRFQPLGTAQLSEPVARFTHGEGSSVLGALLPGSRVVLASATMRASGDLSFANALIRLEPGRAPRLLAEGLAYGSRALVTAEGRVFVSRGVAGRQADEARVDALTIEEIDPTTAKLRTVLAERGFVLFLAGSVGRELIIYAVGPLGARLLAVHVDSLAVRALLPAMPPLARDFVVDAPRRRVLFTQVAPGGWAVEEVRLVDGARQVLAEGPEVTLLPTVLDGRVLISRGPGRGLEALDGREGLAAHGPGFERVRLERGGLVLGLHEVPGGFPTPFALERGRAVELAAPSARLELAGVVP